MLKKTPVFSYLKKTLRSLSLVAIPAAIIYFAFNVLAGNLSPGLPPAGTMRTLEEIYSVLAGASYVSPTVTPSANGNALQVLKCITNRMNTGVGWYKTGGAWSYRKAITIDKTKVANANQTDFPVLVSLTNSDLKDMANSGHVGQSDGGDIFFTYSNGTTKLYHEIEKYDNTTGNLIAWVKVPVLSASADTVIYLYYGNAASANQWDTANVWDSNYKMVQHLSDATTSTTTDNTSNANNGTKLAANEPIETSSGQINKAQNFDGVDDYISSNFQFSPPAGGLNASTISEFINFQTLATAKPIIGKWGNSQNAILLKTDDTNSDELKICAASGLTDNCANYGITTDANIIASAWYNIQIIYDGTQSTNANKLKLYLNGMQKTLSFVGTIPSSLQNAGGNLEIGGDSDLAAYFNVIIDEVRISSAARSVNWIITEYNNQSSASTFYNLGSEENFGC